MVINIAWRNIWRNKKRTLILGSAINFGIIAMIFMTGYMDGIVNAYLETSLNKQYSHIQIHHPKFKEFFQMKYGISNIDELENYLDEKGIKNTKRTIVNGLLSSSKKVVSLPIMVYGIDKEKESNLTAPQNYLIEGKYLEGKRNPIYVSEAIANQLKLKIRSKLQITFSDKEGERIVSVFKVAGIYNMKNGMLDKSRVYVRQSDINRLLEDENYSNEMAIMLDNLDLIDAQKEVLKKTFKNLEIVDWKEVAPELAMMNNSIDLSAYIFKGIILFALIFGVVNTLLMSVMERTKELGILLAIGMNKLKVFQMIVIESILLSIITTPFGMIIAHLLILYYGKNGLDISAYGESLETYGIDPIIYTKVEFSEYVIVTVLLTVTSIIASIYPAIKALNLRPAEAIRK